MDYFIFVSRRTEAPWAVYCPKQKKMFDIRRLRVLVPCVSVTEFGDAFKDYGGSGSAPHYALRANGILDTDGLDGTIFPATTMM